MNRAQSKSYKLLAVASAVREGIAIPPGVLDDQARVLMADEAAAAARQLAWEEYDERLLDDRTWSLAAIKQWLRDTWDCALGVSSIDRDRQRLSRINRVNDLANDRIRRTIDTLKKLGRDDLYQGGVKLILQQLFSLMLRMDVSSLEEMKTGDLLKSMEIFAKAGKLAAEADFQGARTQQLASLRKKVAEAPAAGAMSKDEVLAMIDDVMTGRAQ
jgi:hypothetical protein